MHQRDGTYEEVTPDDPRYEARLRAQHGLVLGAGALPAGVGGGFFFALPLAQAIAGFPRAVIPFGLASVLVSLGIGLLVLAGIQGVHRLVPRFWQLRQSLEELSTDQRIAWYTALAGISFIGAGLGFAGAFFLM